ncbi:sensor histidine kinase [Hyphomonas johnsonii]|uniref:histidine kinase n=1 Tax=Hyphomonas johnsonii MHS-2 TaxID=1280950 RepID=A0A059FQF4_9PROT|nr:PAS domain-containing sensor histidine kinase [Hyphomonas johnsonii]KCZ92884.1 non-motile and phage-resistance protein [Hyphomonas johnsonii MHS-2]
MTEDGVSSGEESVAGKAAERVFTRLKWMIGAIMLLMACALGLKAWEEHQSADIAVLSIMDAEARAVAARVQGRMEATEAAIRLVGASIASRSEISGVTHAIDAIVTLNDARQSPDGSRLAEAAATASGMLERDEHVGLSRQGDIVLVSEQRNGSALMAIAPAGVWLPSAEAGRRITLVSGKNMVGTGDPALALTAADLPDGARGYRSTEGLNRIATVCVPLESSSISVCESVSHPLFTTDDMVRLLIFALLLAAPVLAILGLMNRLSREETTRIIEDTREAEADRIMSLVMRGAKAGYWEWAAESKSLFLSDAAAELLGLDGAGLISVDDLMGRIHPEHRPRMEDTMLRARSIGWVQTSFLTTTSPSRWIELRGSATTDEIDDAKLFGGILLDITERKQSEDRVKDAERRLRTAIESFNGPFALWDHRKRLLYWNRAFALDFGLQDTLRPGMAHDTVVIARAGAVRMEKQSVEDARTNLLELQTGRWLKMVERSTPDGGLITVGVDVTENVNNEDALKRQKQELRKAMQDLERSKGRSSELARKYSEEKAKAEHAAHTKSAFLANMSHELRTPLNAINGFSEIIANELYGPLGDTRYKGYALDILTSGQHLLDMINDILDMAKIEAGKMTINPQPIDPVDPVDAAVRMIRRKAEEKGIEIVLDTQPRLPDIDADHRAIRQMVLNLVSNAIKFTDSGGTITVTVQQRGADIYIAVTDTGIGIPIEDLPRLAKPFEQVSGTRDRNYEGTGLGLALTKSFAEMHGGHMSLSSIEGEGTTVAITLPISGASEFVAETASREVA